MPTLQERNLTARLRPRHKVWFTLGNSFLMGPNYFRFLRAVDQTGTIRQAGLAVGWSYRTCLNRIRRMEETLGTRVLETARGGVSGGGARLSPEGRKLLAIFERWQREMADYSQRAFRRAVER
ncbi:MAG TPA: LysR family transcriptional regulator [Gemmatimonadales bacterium]|nr:LysR family transcriptional regulator [Gemmatimonadales bacterium]